MKNWVIGLTIAGLAGATPLLSAAPEKHKAAVHKTAAASGPQKDYAELLQMYKSRFPTVNPKQYRYGAYALNKGFMEQYKDAMEMNPGDEATDQGKQLWGKAFANGHNYASCFPNGGKGVATGYPKYDDKLKTVVTLPMAINMCRETNGEKPLPYGKSDMVALETYLKSLSNGMPIHVVVKGPAALAKYEAGKNYYFTRRGQLNFSCASCHVQNAGKYIRSDLLSMTLGQAAHFPTYRSSNGKVIDIQARYRGCNKQVRAVPEPFESEDYRNLEYFHTYMSNGYPIEVPGYRK